MCPQGLVKIIEQYSLFRNGRRPVKSGTSHGNEVMRAKSEIFTVFTETFRTKVQTSYDKEEKTSQHALYGPHLPIKEDIPGSALAGRKPSIQKDTELEFWLRCRDDTCKGL